MKKGTRVEFTTKSGKVIEGILEETLEKRAVVKSGNRTYKPPIELVKKSKKKPAKKETPKPKPKPKEEKKERKKVYYIEAHMLSEEEEDIATGIDWKVYKRTSFKTFLKKSMTKKEADMDIIWDSKDSFADSSISKKLN
tara:strand:+ start:375 stop:791 length:417 start_codon:yes stop_codon:yes gene_type:complete